MMHRWLDQSVSKIALENDVLKAILQRLGLIKVNDIVDCTLQVITTTS